MRRSGLFTVYNETFNNIKELIAKAPKTVAMTTDMWTDKYLRRSYITFTLHFTTPDFELHSLVLRTVVLNDAHTGENIKKLMEETINKFSLQDKKIVYITDQGTNIVKACRLAGVDRYGVAHGLHNLITHDGLGKCDEVKNIVDRVKNIIKTFTYKSSLLEQEAERIEQEQLVECLEKVISVINDEEELDEMHENDIQNTDEISRRRKSNSTTLKRDCPTRWNSLLTMLESVKSNQELLESSLTRLRIFDKILDDTEWDIVNHLIAFLSVFKTATAVLSGSTYSTMCLVLLFRAEISRALEANDNDIDVAKELKILMRNSLEHRFPVSDLHVIAAILDPSQRNLASVQSYLTEKNVTAVHLLTQSLMQYTANNEGISAESIEPTNAQCDDVPQWKKAKMELLSKHVITSSSQDREIQQYRCLSMVDTDDILKCWKTQRETFPRLSQLARFVFAIPATSAPLERIFSLAGLTLNVKRSGLAPFAVDKIIFVHANAQQVE